MSNNNDIKALQSGVARLSRMLTRGRHCLPDRYLDDPHLRKAYLEYFLPANEQKVHLPLAELFLHPDAPAAKAELRVLDVGTGPGTSLLGILGFFAQRELRPRLFFTAIDRIEGNLADAERLVRQRSEGTALRTLRLSVEELSSRLKERYDIVVFSNVLNELYNGDDGRIARRIALVGSILRPLLADDGSCIIIEPALRETSRDLLSVRDGLLREGFSVYSPCLVRGRCPALLNPRDWCHEDLPWQPPERIREIDRGAGLRKESLKFSYLVLRKDTRALADAFPDGSFRVVSEPLVSRGKTEFYLCGPAGRRLATRFDKDRTAANGNFEALRRGTVVSFRGLLDEGRRLRIGKETSLEIALPQECGGEGASGPP